jgi:hypothetical protein
MTQKKIECRQILSITLAHKFDDVICNFSALNVKTGGYLAIHTLQFRINSNKKTTSVV